MEEVAPIYNTQKDWKMDPLFIINRGKRRQVSRNIKTGYAEIPITSEDVIQRHCKVRIQTVTPEDNFPFFDGCQVCDNCHPLTELNLQTECSVNQKQIVEIVVSGVLPILSRRASKIFDFCIGMMPEEHVHMTMHNTGSALPETVPQKDRILRRWIFLVSCLKPAPCRIQVIRQLLGVKFERLIFVKNQEAVQTIIFCGIAGSQAMLAANAAKCVGCRVR